MRIRRYIPPPRVLQTSVLVVTFLLLLIPGILFAQEEGTTAAPQKTETTAKSQETETTATSQENQAAAASRENGSTAASRESRTTAALQRIDGMSPAPWPSTPLEAKGLPSADAVEMPQDSDGAALISRKDAEMELSSGSAQQQMIDYRDPYRFWKWPVEDAVSLTKSVTPKVALVAAAGGAILLVAARHDAKLTADLSDLDPPPAELLVRVVEEFGNVRSVRPLAGAIFLGSLMTNNPQMQDAAFTSFEAVILANLITSSLKTAFGRARPYQGEGAREFKPFSGNTSFPSGHATTAFAFVTPWLLYYPNALTPGLVVLGAGTAFTRMLTDNHWFTDVVAGSAIGFATAYFLTQRHQSTNDRVRLTPSLGPDQVGLTVAVKMP